MAVVSGGNRLGGGDTLRQSHGIERHLVVAWRKIAEQIMAVGVGDGGKEGVVGRFVGCQCAGVIQVEAIRPCAQQRNRHTGNARLAGVLATIAIQVMPYGVADADAVAHCYVGVGRNREIHIGIISGQVNPLYGSGRRAINHQADAVIASRQACQAVHAAGIGGGGEHQAVAVTHGLYLCAGDAKFIIRITCNIIQPIRV